MAKGRKVQGGRILSQGTVCIAVFPNSSPPVPPTVHVVEAPDKHTSFNLPNNHQSLNKLNLLFLSRVKTTMCVVGLEVGNTERVNRVQFGRQSCSPLSLHVPRHAGGISDDWPSKLHMTFFHLNVMLIHCRLTLSLARSLSLSLYRLPSPHFNVIIFLHTPSWLDHLSIGGLCLLCNGGFGCCSVYCVPLATVHVRPVISHGAAGNWKQSGG